MALPFVSAIFPAELRAQDAYNSAQAAFRENQEAKADWRKWHAGWETFRTMNKQGLVDPLEGWAFPNADAWYDNEKNKVPIPDQNLSSGPNTMYSNLTPEQQRQQIQYQQTINQRYSQSWKLYYPVRFPKLNPGGLLDWSVPLDSEGYKPEFIKNPAWDNITNKPEIKVDPGQTVKQEYKKPKGSGRTYSGLPPDSPYNTSSIESIGKEESLIGT